MACRLVLNLQGIQPHLDREAESDSAASDIFSHEVFITSFVCTQPPLWSQTVSTLAVPHTSTSTYRFTGERWNTLRWLDDEVGLDRSSKTYEEDHEEVGQEEYEMAVARRSLSRRQSIGYAHADMT